MPQGPTRLHERFGDIGPAEDVLDANFTITRGVIRCKPGYEPTKDEYDAINYLCLEWDYAYI